MKYNSLRKIIKSVQVDNYKQILPVLTSCQQQIFSLLRHVAGSFRRRDPRLPVACFALEAVNFKRQISNNRNWRQAATCDFCFSLFLSRN